MYNWSVDEKEFAQRDPKGYKIWRMEQMINFGLEGKRLREKELKKYWSNIKDNLDPYKKRFLEFLLWRQLYSLPDNLTFWNWWAKTKK